MRVLIFFRDIFKKFPSLSIANILLVTMLSVFEAAAIFTLVPLFDLLVKSDLQNTSFITRKVAEVMRYIGIPVSMMSFIIIFLGFNFFASGFQIMVRYQILRIKYAVVRDLYVGTFDDFFRARWAFFSGNRQGVLFNTFSSAITIVGDAFGAIALFFSFLMQAILYLIVPFYLSWKVSSISLLTAIAFAVPFALLGKTNYKLGKLNKTTSNDISSITQESFSSAKVILGFGNQRENLKLFSNAFDAHCRVTIKSQILAYSVPIIYYPLGLLVVIISFFAARKFGVPLSETVVLLYSLHKVMPYIGQFPALKNSLDNFFPSYEQVLSLRDSARSLIQRSGTRKFEGFKNELVIKGLSFEYPNHKRTLVNINVRVPKGKMVAFVGKSGAGKSTLIDMIMGFNEPTSGDLTLDGVLLQEFDINSYRQRIGYVPQESILFNMSIRDNLRWADGLVSDEELKEACVQANADEFIEEFPNKYDTIVGDRGVRLSGGQIQRVALARAMLRKPDILILDEATSSLDTHSERLIQQAIENIAKETTIIIIAHRLSTIVNSDYIYVLRKGSIVEEGNYAELIKKDGEFRGMLQLQAVGSRQED